MLALTFVVAFVVFCVVQDRVAAAGARRYVALQREALAGRGPAVSIDEVMQPAIEASVKYGVLSAAAVVITGWLAAGLGGGRRQ